VAPRVEIRTGTVWFVPIRFAHELRPDSGVDQRGRFALGRLGYQVVEIDPVRQRAIRGQRGGRAALMRVNIWIVLAVLLALLATTRLFQYQHETQRICADDPSASVCGR